MRTVVMEIKFGLAKPSFWIYFLSKPSTPQLLSVRCGFYFASININQLTKALQGMSQKSNSNKQTPKNSKKRKNPKRQENNQMLVPTSAGRPVGNFSTGVVSANQLTTRPTRGRIGSNIPVGKLSVVGYDFLRSVFGTADYAGQGNFLGIPDDATTDVVSYRHLLAAPLPIYLSWAASIKAFNTINLSCILVQLPTPGVAFWYAFYPTGLPIPRTTVFFPLQYTDYANLFGLGPDGLSNTTVVDNFRMAGHAMELICMSNELTWTGSVRAMKTRFSLVDTSVYQENAGTLTLAIQLNGGESLSSTSNAQYVGASKMGCYQVTTPNQNKLVYKGIATGIQNVNNSNSGTEPDQQMTWAGNWTGLGDLDANVMILDGTVTGTAAAPVFTQFFIRAWQINEYTPNQTGLLNNVRHQSPPLDAEAMRVYFALSKELPVGVSYFENASFWRNLWNAIRGGVKIAGSLPGTVGAIAGPMSGLLDAVNTIAF